MSPEPAHAGRPRETADARQREVAAVLAIGTAMATTRDYAALLAEVIDAVCATLGAAGGGFMRYEPAGQELVLQAPAFGVHAEDVVSRYRVSLADGGNAARVFLSREPYVANDARHDPRFIQRFVRLFDTRNTVTVPLVLGDRPLGIFHAINKHAGDFTDADRDLLVVVAPLLAACLQSALMFRAVEHERHQLARSLEVHSRLLETAVDAQGVEAVCATLHGLLGRPLVLLDALRRPLASFDWRGDFTRLARDLAGLRGRDGLLQRLAEGGRRLAVVTVVVAGERAGHLVVAEDGAPLDAIDGKALEQAATLLAVEIFKQRSLTAAETRAASALLAELFSAGLTDAEARALLARLGVESAGPWRVALLRFAGGGAETTALVHRHATVLREALERALGSLKRPLRLMHWRDGFAVVQQAGLVERLGDRALLRRLQQALDALTSLPAPLVLEVGIGRAEQDAATLGTSLRTAGQALAAIARLGPRVPVLTFEDLGVYRLLLGDNDEAGHRAFMQQVLEPLLAPGRAPLLGTLSVLFEENFNLAATARAQGVHLNTVKYRVQQLRDLLGGDPSRGELRLELELALRIRALGWRGEGVQSHG